MKLLLQRVSEAAVVVDGDEIAKIGKGLLVFVGVVPDDSQVEADWLVDKALSLRIFPDVNKPMNQSVLDVAGEVLVVSQFTLAADTTRGKRPSFTTAAQPTHAKALYDYFISRMGEHVAVQTGAFGADMAVSLVNDGPVTFILERTC